MFRVQDGIYNIEGLQAGRVYVIVGNDGLTLIDTSVPNSVPQIKKELQKIGFTLDTIKRIVITHAHYDHIGSLPDLKKATGATVYAHHRYESAVIRGEKPVMRPAISQLHGLSRFMASRFKVPEMATAPVDRELKEGDRLDEVLPGLEVVDTPGHSPGHCSLWQPEQGLLFAGDAIIRMPFKLRPPLDVFTSDIAEARRSIYKLAELDVKTLCMGHGKPLVDNAGPALKALAQTL